MKTESLDDNLDDLMSQELGISTGHKDAIKALMETKEDKKGRDDIDFKTDLVPREINGMAVVQTTGKITKFTTTKPAQLQKFTTENLFGEKTESTKFSIQNNITATHQDFAELLGEFLNNHKRLRVSKLRMGRRETASIFSPTVPLSVGGDPRGEPRRKGLLGGLFSPRQEGR